jgi:hypothetical protein
MPTVAPIQHFLSIVEYVAYGLISLLLGKAEVQRIIALLKESQKRKENTD